MSGPEEPLVPLDQPIENEVGSLGEFAETIIDKDGEVDPEAFDEPGETDE